MGSSAVADGAVIANPKIEKIAIVQVCAAFTCKGLQLHMFEGRGSEMLAFCQYEVEQIVM